MKIATELTRMTMMNKPTIGADPELFLINPDGKFISSIGLIGGSKARPLPIGEGCAVQEDNVAVEFNIAPATEVDKFVASCNYALEYLTKAAAEKGLLLSITASKTFDADQLDNDRARTFGCEADFNAWTRRMNKMKKPANANLRSCGGHVHIGSDLDKIQLVRWCDVMLGLPSVLEDDDTDRRSLYGAAGCFRPKSYGVEYRTLSNYWLKSEDMMKKVWERTQAAVARVASGRQLGDGMARVMQATINESNKAEATRLMAKYA
jgi:hypothetical protein